LVLPEGRKQARTRGVGSAVQKPLASGKRQKRAGVSTLKQSRGTTNASDWSVPTFETDSDRYEWEIQQRFESMDTLDRWVAADGVYTIGPPIPPKAVVFFDDVATKAFEKGTKDGYLACRPAAEKLGISRKSVRLFVDRLTDTRVAYVVYPGKIKNSRYHCRMIHRNSIRTIKKNVPYWMKKARQGGKKTTAENLRRGR
tara:strand:+ start:262 stop:858 length:597 start_codon:yes stop_codon:yes gene_type:complete